MVLAMNLEITEALDRIAAVRQRVAARLPDQTVNELRLDLAGRSVDDWLDWKEAHSDAVEQTIREALAISPQHVIHPPQDQRRLDYAALVHLDLALIGLRIMRDFGIHFGGPCPIGLWYQKSVELVHTAQENLAQLHAWPLPPPDPWNVPGQ